MLRFSDRLARSFMNIHLLGGVRAFWFFSSIAVSFACSDVSPSKTPANDANGGTPDSGGSPSTYGGEAGSGGMVGDSGGNGGAGNGGTGAVLPDAGGSAAVIGSTVSGGQTSATTLSTVGGNNTITTTYTPVTITHPKFLGNITTNNAADVGKLKYSTHWNQITPENAGKWGNVQGSATSAFNWTTLDAIYDYAQKNNVIFKEHAFVWGSQQPAGTITETLIKNWMTAFCARYPNTKIIDVINEPPPHTEPKYVNAIGGGTNTTWQWVINVFNWARTACPNAILVMNDYNNIEYPGDAANFVNLAKFLKSAGAPIDAVGAQAHAVDDASVTFDTVKTLLTNLHKETTLPVYITELDISTTDDVAQLTLYQQYLPLFMETDYVKGVTIWGWIYGSTWYLSPYSGLVKNGVSRSAMNYMMDYVGRSAP